MLDLFCGLGGATRGYQDAGWYVIGVDKYPQPDYIGDEFIQDDALTYLARIMKEGTRAQFAHASPPCQAACALTSGTNAAFYFGSYPQLIPATRHGLDMLGLPYVIENVAGAPIRKDLMLCGEMYGLGVLRHRFFETGGGLKLSQPAHMAHRGRVAGMRHGVWYEGPYFAVYGNGGGKGSVSQWREAMRIDWSWSRKGIAEAIPPAYTQEIGKQCLQRVVAAVS